MKNRCFTSLALLILATTIHAQEPMRDCPPSVACPAPAARFCTITTDCLIVNQNCILNGNVTGAGLDCISGGSGGITGPTGATGATGPLECVCCFTDQLIFGPFQMQSQGINPLTTEPTAFSPYAPTSNASLYGWELPVPGSDPNNTITMQFEVPSDYNSLLGFTLDLNIIIEQAGQPAGNILLNVFSDFIGAGQEANSGSSSTNSQQIGVAEPIGGPSSVRQQRLTLQLNNPNASIDDLGQISISRIPASSDEYNASIYLATASLIYRKSVCSIEA